MPRYWRIIVAGIVLGASALGPASTLGKAGGTDRPWKSSATATATLDLGTLSGTSVGSGHAAHLGKVTPTQTFTLTPTADPATFATAGTSTIVAANGDQLFATSAGTLTSTGLQVGATAEFTFVSTITGGTGRFADASGRLTTTGNSVVVSIAGGTVTSRQTFGSEGTITY